MMPLLLLVSYHVNPFDAFSPRYHFVDNCSFTTHSFSNAAHTHMHAHHAWSGASAQSFFSVYAGTTSASHTTAIGTNWLFLRAFHFTIFLRGKSPYYLLQQRIPVFLSDYLPTDVLFCRAVPA